MSSSCTLARECRRRHALTLALVLVCAAAAVLVAAPPLPAVAAGPPPAAAQATPTPRQNGKIAFARLNDIYSVNPDGTGEVRLTNDEQWEDSDPDWSPDGTEIVFIRRAPNTYNLYRMRADGGGATPLTTSSHPDANSYPEWSPDGTKIVFVSFRDMGKGSGIWVVNRDGGGETRLLASVFFPTDTINPVYSGDWEPVWSPDGKRIAFSSNRDDLRNRDIYVMDADGGNLRRLTTDASEDRAPLWTPDGARLLFTKQRDNGFHTYVMNADGSGQQPSPDHPTTFWADFSPDGRKFVYATFAGPNFTGEIFVRNADGTGPVTQLTANAWDDFSPSWQVLNDASPPTPTHDVAGRVVDAQGAPLPGVTVSAAGASALSTQTDAEGRYRLRGLTRGGSYRVEAALAGRVFAPARYDFGNLSADQAADFVAHVAVQITGSVTGDPGYIPTVRLTGAEERTVEVQFSNFSYAFTGLRQGASYTVTPVSPIHDFTPASQTFSPLTSNQVANFAAVRRKFSVSGRITRRKDGSPFAGARVDLLTGGTTRASVTTGADGSYRFDGLNACTTFCGYDIRVDVGTNYFVNGAVIDALTADRVLDFAAASRNNVVLGAQTVRVAENGRSVQIRVFRGGNDAGVGPVSVDYATADGGADARCDAAAGRALARCDYGTVAGTLNWVDGEHDKTITIPLTDDAFAEGDETFTLTLGNVVGDAELAGPATAVITIADNDATTGANPVESTPFFVRQQYVDFLSREPEAGEPWSAVLNKCPNVNGDESCDRVTVSGAFFRSPEFHARGYLVFRFYRVSFGRLPRYSEIVADLSRVTGQTAEETAARRAAFIEAWARRPEFTALYPATLGHEEFVNRLLATAQVQPAGAASAASLVEDLRAGRRTRADVVRAVVESPEVDAREFNGAFVAMQYFGYLRRDPEPAGYQAWLNYLNANPSDFRTMVTGFVNSREYRLRFGPE